MIKNKHFKKKRNTSQFFHNLLLQIKQIFVVLEALLRVSEPIRNPFKSLDFISIMNTQSPTATFSLAPPTFSILFTRKRVGKISCQWHSLLQLTEKSQHQYILFFSLSSNQFLPRCIARKFQGKCLIGFRYVSPLPGRNVLNIDSLLQAKYLLEILTHKLHEQNK